MNLILKTWLTIGGIFYYLELLGVYVKFEEQQGNHL